MIPHDPEQLQAAVTLISSILTVFGISGLGGIFLIFYRLGDSRQKTLSTLESIKERLSPLESWRERRGEYMTRPDCKDEHEKFDRRLDDRLTEFINDISSLKADRKTMMSDISELKVMMGECLTEIRVRNERKSYPAIVHENVTK